MTTVSIARDFSVTPGGRTDDDGPNNGRKFRLKFLETAVQQGGHLTIDLDGVAGLPGSFCDEAFGELVRIHQLSKERFYRLFDFIGNGDEYRINKGMIDLNVERALRDSPGP